MSASEVREIERNFERQLDHAASLPTLVPRRLVDELFNPILFDGVDITLACLQKLQESSLLAGSGWQSSRLLPINSFPP